MSEVGIDALIIKTRATVRELNNLLSELNRAGVWTTVADRHRLSNDGQMANPGKVYLGLYFEPEKGE